MDAPSPQPRASLKKGLLGETVARRSPSQSPKNKCAAVMEPTVKHAPPASPPRRPNPYRAVAKDLSPIMARLEPNILKLFSPSHAGADKKAKDTQLIPKKPAVMSCSLSQPRLSDPRTSLQNGNEDVGSPPRCFDSTHSMSIVTPPETRDQRLNQIQSMLTITNIMLNVSPETLVLQDQLSQDVLTQETLQELCTTRQIPSINSPSRQQTLVASDWVEHPSPSGPEKDMHPVKYHIMGPFTLPKLSFIQQGMRSTEYDKESRYLVGLLCQQQCVSHYINYDTMLCYSIRRSHTNLPYSTIVALDSIKRIVALHNLKRKYRQYFNLSALLLDVLSGGIFNEEQLSSPKDSWCKDAFTALTKDQQRQVCNKLRLRVGLVVDHINNNCVVPQFCDDNISLDCLMNTTGKDDKGIKADKYINTLTSSLVTQSFTRSLSKRSDFEQLRRDCYTNDIMVDIVLMHFSLMFDTFYGTTTFCASPFMFLGPYNSIASTFYRDVDLRTQGFLESTELSTERTRLWLIDMVIFPICCNNHWSIYMYIGKQSKLSNVLTKLCGGGSKKTGRPTLIWVDNILQCNSMLQYPVDESYNKQIIQYMNALDKQLGSEVSTGSPHPEPFTRKSVVSLQICQQRDQYSCAYHMFVLVFSLLSMLQDGYRLPDEMTPEHLASGDWTGLYRQTSANAMKYWVLQYLINNSTYEETQGTAIDPPRTSKQASLGLRPERSESSSSSVHIVTED